MKLLANLVACAALSGACAQGLRESRPDAPVVLTPKQLRPGQIIVALAADEDEALAAVRRSIAVDYGLVEVGRFLLGSVQLECVVFESGEVEAVPGLVDRLNHDARVKLAEVNQVFQGESADSFGGANELSYGAGLIRADAAHRTSTGRGVKVAVIDTGVSAAHPGLRGRIARTQNFVEGGEASFARDLHGTAVAGIIAAQHEGVRPGMLGIAPDAEIIAIKACWYAGGAKALCSSWTLAKALDFAVEASAQVINLSLSGPADGLLRRLIEKAQERGIILVAAAAEGAVAPGFPASVPGVIAVVASDARGQTQLPAWTEQTYVMVAPGVEILTTVPGTGYDFVTGSSFAAAHVTGVVALLREENPRLTAPDALALLKATARPVPGNELARRAGLIDACAALGKLMGSPSCP